jgi:hypothetical protein
VEDIVLTSCFSFIPLAVGTAVVVQDHNQHFEWLTLTWVVQWGTGGPGRKTK